MNFKSAIAKVYLPPGLKFKSLLTMYSGALLSLYTTMDKNASPIFRKALTDVGKMAAETMKKELNLKNTFEDAVDSWIIGSKALNITISLEKTHDEVIFTHVYCPMWEYFRKNGRILCEDLCIPVAETTVKEIYPDVKVVMLRHPDENNTCIKALRR